MKPTIGRMVHYVPPQDCKGKTTLDLYAAVIVKVNPGIQPAGDYGGCDETVELATLGPNSLYFQHGVPFAEELKPGHWSWPKREV
jgi:hypothetical protein